jgi:hypothetical protein
VTVTSGVLLALTFIRLRFHECLHVVIKVKIIHPPTAGEVGRFRDELGSTGLRGPRHSRELRQCGADSFHIQVSVCFSGRSTFVRERLLYDERTCTGGC